MPAAPVAPVAPVAPAAVEASVTGLGVVVLGLVHRPAHGLQISPVQHSVLDEQIRPPGLHTGSSWATTILTATKAMQRSSTNFDILFFELLH